MAAFAVATLVAAVAAIPDLYSDGNPFNRPPPVGTDPNFDCEWRSE
jgi:hypothetical protein